MIKGSVTGLRAVERDDLPQLLEWRNQPLYRRFFREDRELNSFQQERWFEETVVGGSSTRMFSIVELDGGRLIGACGLCYINWRDRNADLSLYIGIGGLYIDDTYAPDAARTLLHFGFEEMGLHRIWAEIYSVDTAKEKLFKSLGMTLDGRHRETRWTAGHWVDSLFFSVLADEYRICGDV